MLSVAVAQLSSDNNAMAYVLPVLWMTSCFRAMLFRRVRQVAAPVGTSDNVVWLRSAGGGTGYEVCCLRLHLVSFRTSGGSKLRGRGSAETNAIYQSTRSSSDQAIKSLHLAVKTGRIFISGDCCETVCATDWQVGADIKLASSGLTSIITFKPVFLLVNDAQVLCRRSF